MTSHRVLLVANKTASTPQLRQAVRARVAAGQTRFMLLVPSEAPSGTMTFEEAECWHEAELRVGEVVRELQDLGASVEGKVGANNPYEAVLDQLSGEVFEEVVISTHPVNVWVWLGFDLVSRLRTATNVYVTQLDTAPPPPHGIQGNHVDPDRPVGRY